MPTYRERNGRIQVQVRLKEGKEIVYQESATFDTQQQATLWGLALEARLKQHGAPAARLRTLTVADVIQEYQRVRESAKGRKLSRGFEHSIGNILSTELAKKKAADLTTAEIFDWAIKRKQAGNAPATIMHHLAVLSAAYRAAPAIMGMPVDPTVIANAITQLRSMAVVQPSERRDRRITDAELALVMPEMHRQNMQINAWGFVQLAILLPRRREELLTMQWADISADGKTIYLRDTKDPRKVRNETVPLPPKAKALIDTFPKIDARILPFKPESISRAWQRAVARAGIPDARLHDLRHEGISRLFEQGLTIEEVSLISGHTSWVTLRRYTHLRPSQVTDKLALAA